MGKFLIYLLLFAVIFMLFKASTFGWRLLSTSYKPAKNSSLIAALKSHVVTLSDKIGDRSMFKYEKLEEAADYVTEQFNAAGYNPDFQKYPLMTEMPKNIIATKKGLSLPQEVIIVGAHYDTCFNPGADDNASGVAVLLELSKMLKDAKTRRTIKFIAFVNEEPPFFQTQNMGSAVYVKEAKKRGESLKGAVILEMVGYYQDKPNSQRYPLLLGPFFPNRANFICAVSNFASWQFLRKFTKAFKKGSKFPLEAISLPSFVSGIDFSDHYSFWKEQYPAIMVTDTAFYRNPDYHTKSDTYQKLDYGRMAEVVGGLGEALKELAK